MINFKVNKLQKKKNKTECKTIFQDGHRLPISETKATSSPMNKINQNSKAKTTIKISSERGHKVTATFPKSRTSWTITQMMINKLSKFDIWMWSRTGISNIMWRRQNLCRVRVNLMILRTFLKRLGGNYTNLLTNLGVTASWWKKTQVYWDEGNSALQ